LSVVIPALNEERHLAQLLSDIQRQSQRLEEVIVVDAGSRDASVRIAEQSPVAVVIHGEPPIARGRNLGGYSATGDLIFFLDADTRLPETFLEDLPPRSNADAWTSPAHATSLMIPRPR